LSPPRILEDLFMIKLINLNCDLNVRTRKQAFDQLSDYAGITLSYDGKARMFSEIKVRLLNYDHDELPKLNRIKWVLGSYIERMLRNKKKLV